MWGSLIFGKTRWAAVKGSVPAGLTFTPAPAVFEFEGGAAPAVTGVNALIHQVMVRETLRSANTGATEILVQALVRETLRSTELARGRRRMSLM